MKIKIDLEEIISFKDFELCWRWDETHNNEILISEIEQIQPFSKLESKRLNRIIDYFEIEDSLDKHFIQTEWIFASSESKVKIEEFSNQLLSTLKNWDENVIIKWDRTTTLMTTKDIFIKYWYDFFYPSSDEVTVISEHTNWVIFYKHYEIAKFYTRKK